MHRSNQRAPPPQFVGATHTRHTYERDGLFATDVGARSIAQATTDLVDRGGYTSCIDRIQYFRPIAIWNTKLPAANSRPTNVSQGFLPVK